MILSEKHDILQTIDRYPLFGYISAVMIEEEDAAEDEVTANQWRDTWNYIYACYLVKEGYDLA